MTVSYLFWLLEQLPVLCSLLAVIWKFGSWVVGLYEFFLKLDRRLQSIEEHLQEIQPKRVRGSKE